MGWYIVSGVLVCATCVCMCECRQVGMLDIALCSGAHVKYTRRM